MAANHLEEYSGYLVDRLFDMRDAMAEILMGKGGDPRLIARRALADDDKAHAAIKAEFQAKLGEPNGRAN